MLRTSRSIQNNRMRGYNSTADMPVPYNPLSINNCELWVDASSVSGTTWTDKSGNSTNGTIAGSPSFGTVSGRECLAFAGGQKVTFAHPLNTSTSNSFCIVVKDNNQGAERMFGFDSTSSSSSPIQAGNQSGSWWCDWKDPGDYTLSSNASVTSSWTFLCFVYDSSAGTGTIYVNGSYDNSTFANMYDDTGTNFLVGSMKEGALSYPYNGWISDFLIYSAAISSSDVAALATYYGF